MCPLFFFFLNSRSQTIVDASNKPLADQTPREGVFMSMLTHIPPSMDPSQKKHPAHVIITKVDPEAHRLSWRTTAWRWFLNAERWQALSVVEVEIEGSKKLRTKYESHEVFAGLAGWIILWFMRDNLQLSLDAMTEGVKTRAEQLQQ